MPSPARQSGFTYLMLLWWVAMSGVLLMAISQRWSIESRRQQDMELLFRGEQIRLAIESYAKVPVPAGASPLPARLEDLLEDRRGGATVRHHLRRLWPDPVTRSARWGLVQSKEGITGVYSLSKQKPLRAPPGVESYADWRFQMGQAQPQMR